MDLIATRFGFIEQGKLVREISHVDLHEHTKKSLVVEVNDAVRACAVLEAKLGITGAKADGNRLLLESHFEQPNLIAQALVSEGLELHRLSPQETTLEEYFMLLIGGAHNV